MRPHMSSSFHWNLRITLLVCGLVTSASAEAQGIAEAAALFDRGLADMEAGRYETGCKALAESRRLAPQMGTLFTLATCEARWGHIATAVARYGEYLTLYERLPDDRKVAQGERPNVVKAEIERLAPDVPRLTLSLPRTAPAGTIVMRDGELVAEVALGVALPVDPGEHTLSTQVPGGKVQEQRITIGKGEKRVMTLTVKVSAVPTVKPPPVSSAPKPPAPVGAGPSRSNVGPILAFGAGAAGLGIGIGLGAAVLGKRAELDKACPGNNCPVSEQGNLESAKALSYVSTAGFVVAGVGAAVGTVLLLLPAPSADQAKSVRVRVGVGQLRVEGSF